MSAAIPLYVENLSGYIANILKQLTAKSLRTLRKQQAMLGSKPDLLTFLSLSALVVSNMFVQVFDPTS